MKRKNKVIDKPIKLRAEKEITERINKLELSKNEFLNIGDRRIVENINSRIEELQWTLKLR